VSILGDKEQTAESLDALERSRGFLKSKIGHRLKLRYVPQLRFVLDETLDESARIESLLKETYGEK
jgi:ribosome-binding factor A